MKLKLRTLAAIAIGALILVSVAADAAATPPVKPGLSDVSARP